MAEILPEAELLDLRKKIINGYEATDDEIARVIATLRAKRGNIGTGGGSSKKAPVKPIDLNTLFS